MILEQWIEINDHMKNKFQSLDKVEEISSLSLLKKASIKTLDLEDNIIYSTQFICIAVDIRNSSSQLYNFDGQQWNAILSEFAYGITKIMKIYDAKYVKIQGDSVFGIFESNKKEKFDNVFDCAVDINTFKAHLNKVIEKYLMSDNYDSELHYIDYGIGLWFNDQNFVSKIGHSSTRDVVFSGDAVNLSNKLSKIAMKNIEHPILFNELIYENFSNKYLTNNQELFEDIDLDEFDEEIYGSNAIFKNYLNWIENNV